MGFNHPVSLIGEKWVLWGVCLISRNHTGFRHDWTIYHPFVTSGRLSFSAKGLVLGEDKSPFGPKHADNVVSYLRGRVLPDCKTGGGMEYRDTGLPGHTPRPEPSWPKVIATTVRLWLEHHPIVVGNKTTRIRPLVASAQAGGRQGILTRKRFATFALVAGLLVTGAGTAGLVLARHPTATQWGTADALPAPAGPIAGVGQPPGARIPLPVALTIPAIGVRTSLIDLGLTASGALQVPSSTAVAGWYTGSPRPGAIGPAVIAGHIDSHVGPGVFFHLSQLRPGDPVYVRRADGTLAVFRVTAVWSYAKDRFPTLAVYGPTPDAELRLITCGGTFDPQLRSYLNNTVVYAVQVSDGSH
jgi:hypothetical protein